MKKKFLTWWVVVLIILVGAEFNAMLFPRASTAGGPREVPQA